MKRLIIVIFILGLLLLTGCSKPESKVSWDEIPTGSAVDYSATEDTGEKISDLTEGNAFKDTKLNPFD